MPALPCRAEAWSYSVCGRLLGRYRMLLGEQVDSFGDDTFSGSRDDLASHNNQAPTTARGVQENNVLGGCALTKKGGH